MTSDNLISAKQVRVRLGNVSDMFLWRSLHHGDFPRPIWIGSRRFWRESAVLAWIAEREVAPPPTSRRPGRKAA